MHAARRTTAARRVSPRPWLLLLMLWMVGIGAPLHAAVWLARPDMPTARAWHTSTLLTDGRVLVVGGLVNGQASNSAQIYDPLSYRWSTAATMGHARTMHSATLLANGRVLVVGGRDAAGALAPTEIYDPQTNSWSTTGNLTRPRAQHTATRLINGEVLVVGGRDNTNVIASAERYDPINGTWRAAGALTTARAEHTAVLLLDGRVLVVGGQLTSVERFDPGSNTWSAAASLASPIADNSLTVLGNGRVLLAGGTSNGVLVSNTALYNPVANTWSAGPFMSAPRFGHHASVLPSGQVVLAGGNSSALAGFLPSTIYDPVANTLSNSASQAVGRRGSAAVLLPNGELLQTGGLDDNEAPLASTESYDTANTAFSAGASMTQRHRSEFTTTVMPDGRVIITGGTDPTLLGGWGNVRAVEIYDPAAATWTRVNDLSMVRSGHRATLLNDGRLFVQGGLSEIGQLLKTGEVYDPATGQWTPLPSSQFPHWIHTQELLPDGRVLVAGGPNFGELTGSEIFDPTTSTWTPTASMITPRFRHATVRLADGRILVIGGDRENNSGPEPSAEIFDPSTQTWSAAGSLAFPRVYPVATLLTDGRVLVIGGLTSGGNYTRESEIYDPVSNTWSSGGTTLQRRHVATATLLRDGSVLVVGGDGSQFSDSTAERFDPVSNTWRSAGEFANLGYRFGHGAALLHDGRVLVFGGFNFDASNTSTLIDPQAGRDTSRVPTLTSVPATRGLSQSFIASGTGLVSALAASSGTTGGNASNVPVLRARRLDNGYMRDLALTSNAMFSETSVETLVGALGPMGPGWVDVSVAVNGLRSASRAMLLTGGSPGAPSAVTAQAGNARAIVRFPTPPADDGGAPVLRYRVTSAPGGVTATCDVPCTSLVMNGLTNGVAYTFTVRAINSVGVGPPSPASNAVTPGAAACAGSGLTAQASVLQTPRCANSIDGRLLASATGGVMPYTYLWSPSDSTDAQLEFALGGTYQVTITDALACTSTTSITLVAPPALTVSLQSTTTSPRGTCNGSATANVSGGVSPYTYEWAPTQQTTQTATALCAGEHTVLVSDANACVVTSATRVIEPPSAPTLLAVVAGDAQVALGFTAPTSDGGEPVQSYQGTCGAASVTGPASPLSVTGLVNGESVTCTVRASNTAGFGPASSVSIPITPRASQTIVFGAAPVVRINTTGTLTATGGGSGQPVRFESRTPATCTTSGNNGETVQGISVGACSIAANQDGNNAFNPAPEALLNFEVRGTLVAITPSVTGVGTIDPSSVQMVEQGASAVFMLTPEGTRQVSVTGTCGGTLVGNTFTSAPAQQDCTVIANFFDVPGLINNFTLVAEDGAARYTIVPPSTDNSPILDYTATCMPGSITVVSTTPIVLITGLTNNFTYRCSVKARSAAGFGPSSPTRSVIPGTAGNVADVRITIDNGRDFVDGGQPVEYIVTVVNAGPAGVVNAPVYEEAQIDFIAATWFCNAPPAAGCRGTGIDDLNARVDLPINVPVQIIYRVMYDPAAETPVSRIVTVLTPNGITDPDLTNNVASDGPDRLGVFRDQFE